MLCFTQSVCTASKLCSLNTQNTHASMREPTTDATPRPAQDTQGYKHCPLSCHNLHLLCCRSRGRHGAKYTEEMEDQALLADEDTGGERAGHRLMAQPSVIKGGQMREYQMQGLNWLIHLYDNGINGILADEMVSLHHSLLHCLHNCNSPMWPWRTWQNCADHWQWRRCTCHL